MKRSSLYWCGALVEYFVVDECFTQLPLLNGFFLCQRDRTSCIAFPIRTSLLTCVFYFSGLVGHISVDEGMLASKPQRSAAGLTPQEVPTETSYSGSVVEFPPRFLKELQEKAQPITADAQGNPTGSFDDENLFGLLRYPALWLSLAYRYREFIQRNEGNQYP